MLLRARQRILKTWGGAAADPLSDMAGVAVLRQRGPAKTMIRPHPLPMSCLVMLAALSQAGAATVDRMTCAAARAQVLATGRYATPPPWPPTPTLGYHPAEGPPTRRPRHTDAPPTTERTLDDPRCYLGYTCNPRIRFRCPDRQPEREAATNRLVNRGRLRYVTRRRSEPQALRHQRSAARWGIVQR